MSREKILSIIQALLEKTVQNGCTEAEAEIASLKVGELLTKYNLSLSEIRIQKSTPIKIIEKRGDYLGLRKKQEWMTSLATSVANFCFCSLLTSQSSPLLWFVGTEENSEVALLLFESLVRSLWDLAFDRTHEYVQEFKKDHGFSPQGLQGIHHPKTWRRSYLTGVVHKLSLRMREQRQEDFREAGVQSLVLHHSQLVSDFLSNKYPKLSSRSGLENDSLHPYAFHQGSQDGESLSLSTYKSQIEGG